eukprot:scaffold3841_cov412-Prasinococcus_capsulatus_cf.AAC.6
MPATGSFRPSGLSPTACGPGFRGSCLGLDSIVSRASVISAAATPTSSSGCISCVEVDSAFALSPEASATTNGVAVPDEAGASSLPGTVEPAAAFCGNIGGTYTGGYSPAARAPHCS